MATATLTGKKIKTATKIVSAKEETLQEWLASEVSKGTLIAPTNIKPIPKPERPEPGLDWYSVYKLSRTDL